MKKSRVPFYLLIGILVVVGLAFSMYRHFVFGVPWLPGEKRQIWSVEAKVEFVANDGPVKVSLTIPSRQAGFTRLSEHTASPGYGLAYIEDEVTGRRVADWSIRNAKGKQMLYYRVEMLVDPDRPAPLTVKPPVGEDLGGQNPHTIAAKELLERAHSLSSDSYTLARELILEFNNRQQTAEFLQQKHNREEWLVKLLSFSNVPARTVYMLSLEDGRRRQQLVSYLQVFDGDKYSIFNPRTGRQGVSGQALLWEAHSGPLLDLVGGSNSKVFFSMIRQDVPATALIDGISAKKNILDFSIHSLPLEDQALFKGILLIPVGVLVVVLLRVLVGIRTSGTFMPVLIAISFIQTTLITGIVGFILIVSVGLMIRSYLSQLNLLLVARISAVIISVIIIIAALSILAFQIGLSEGLKITFFPMIILSWTIERMSILWEEEGAQEVLVQGGGSLLVAVLTYMLMMNEVVRHLTFNFIGLQLVMMAFVLLLGSYTGYRLLELRRFKPVLESN